MPGLGRAGGVNGTVSTAVGGEDGPAALTLEPAGTLFPGAMRFGFWGRVSTEDHQDPHASRVWQVTRAATLIEPFGGQIACEYFDQGQSRSVPPQRRPEAGRLLAALSDPGRGFDAVVIAEPQRAFYGSQFATTFPCSRTGACRCGSPRLAALSTPIMRPMT
jgi:hypothetical protein